MVNSHSLGLLVVVALSCLYFTTVVSSSTEILAGKAISKLLQEKISMKFKEAANEVKGVLVKHLGDSLKSAHNRMNPKKKAKKIAKMIKAGKGGAAAHQNQAGRHRKNSGGPPGAFAPPKPNNAQQMGPFGMPLPGPSGPAGPAGPQGPPGQAGAMQRPGAAPQCGGSCPATCAPTCDNTCCQMASQPAPSGGCPAPCWTSCFSYCPESCCQHKKNKIPLKRKTKSEDDDE